MQTAADVTVRQANVEKLPFADGQFDHAIATLVFSSVDDPAASLAEIRRVTKAGGNVRLLEHVRADGRSMRRLQGWLTPLWQLMTDGCHLDRETVPEVERAGLEIESHESVPKTPGFVPVKVSVRASQTLSRWDLFDRVMAAPSFSPREKKPQNEVSQRAGFRFKRRTTMSALTRGVVID